MPRYIIQRNLGKVTLQQVEAAGLKSKQVREANFPDITWNIRMCADQDGMRTYWFIRAERGAGQGARCRTGLPATRSSIFHGRDPANL